MLSPKDSPLGKQLSRYVCLRITRLDDVDIGLFDRDWNNAIYFFAMNAEEQIYFRYGGRDSGACLHRVSFQFYEMERVSSSAEGRIHSRFSSNLPTTLGLTLSFQL